MRNPCLIDPLQVFEATALEIAGEDAAIEMFESLRRVLANAAYFTEKIGRLDLDDIHNYMICFFGHFQEYV